MTKNQTETKNQGDEFQPEFVDWRELNQDSYNKYWSTENILKHFGNDLDSPDTNNATVIRYDLDCKPKHSKEFKKWKRLALYNTGAMNLGWGNDPYLTYQTNSHMIDGLMDKLEMTPLQRGKAYLYFMGLNLGEEGLNAELMAFCVCAVILHQDGSGRSYHPNQLEENKDPVFVEMADKLGLKEKAISSVYRDLEQRISKGLAEVNYDFLQYEKRRLVSPFPEKSGI